jgi:hypothetical protein
MELSSSRLTNKNTIINGLMKELMETPSVEKFYEIIQQITEMPHYSGYLRFYKWEPILKKCLETREYNIVEIYIDAIYNLILNNEIPIEDFIGIMRLCRDLHSNYLFNEDTSSFLGGLKEEIKERYLNKRSKTYKHWKLFADSCFKDPSHYPFLVSLIEHFWFIHPALLFANIHLLKKDQVTPLIQTYLTAIHTDLSRERFNDGDNNTLSMYRLIQSPEFIHFLLKKQHSSKTPQENQFYGSLLQSMIQFIKKRELLENIDYEYNVFQALIFFHNKSQTDLLESLLNKLDAFFRSSGESADSGEYTAIIEDFCMFYIVSPESSSSLRKSQEAVLKTLLETRLTKPINTLKVQYYENMPPVSLLKLAFDKKNLYAITFLLNQGAKMEEDIEKSQKFQEFVGKFQEIWKSAYYNPSHPSQAKRKEQFDQHLKELEALISSWKPT